MDPTNKPTNEPQTPGAPTPTGGVTPDPAAPADTGTPPAGPTGDQTPPTGQPGEVTTPPVEEEKPGGGAPPQPAA